MFLVDSNIFLEGLLEQEQSTKVKSFLENTNTDKLYITNFSLHSIGVLLTRAKKMDLFRRFINEVILNRIEVLSITSEDLNKVIENIERFSIDFDDAYQFSVAKENNLTVVTQDRDFERVKNEIAVNFI